MKNPGLRICPFFNLASMVDNYFELVKTLFTNSKVKNTAYGDGDCRWYKLTCFVTSDVFFAKNRMHNIFIPYHLSTITL